MSYYQKQKLSYSADGTIYEGNSKNFWKDSIFAKNPKEAEELRRLMSNSSLSHAQAKRLVDYAFQNPTNNFVIYATYNLFKGLVEEETFEEIVWVLTMLLERQTDKVLERLGRKPDQYPTAFMLEVENLATQDINDENVRQALEFIKTCRFLFPFDKGTPADRESINDISYRLHLISQEITKFKRRDASLLKQERIENLEANISAARDYTGHTFLDVIDGFKQYFEEQMQKSPYKTIDMDGETAFQYYCQKHGEKNDTI